MKIIKQLFPYFEFSILTVLFYFQMVSIQNMFFGFFLFGFSLLELSSFWKKVYASMFPEDEQVIARALSFFTPISLFGLFTGIPVAWYHLTPCILSVCYFLVFLCSLGASLLCEKKNTNHQKEEKKYAVVSSPGMLPLFYFIVYFFAWFALFAPSNGILQTPWQAIAPTFLILFFLLTVLLGYILISSMRTRGVLFFLLLHSVLLHMYLPLSHTLPWGGDVWRTLAVEEKLRTEKSELPVLFGEGVKWRNYGTFSLPEALVIPNKYVYSHLWGETVFLSKMLSVDLVTLNRFLVPVLWSLFVPLILFALGKRLFDTEKKALFFSFLSFLPFPLQALGGLTLAVSFGFLQFLFLLLLWVEYIQSQKKEIKILTLSLGALSIFGYTLFFFLFWMMVLVTLLLQAVQKEKMKNVVWKILAVLGIFAFPALELLAKIDHIPRAFNWWTQLKQFLGQWSGWYYASQIRAHDIVSGNIIFNHTPTLAFVENIFTTQRWHLMVLMALVFFFLAASFVFLRKEKRLEWKVLSILLSTLLGGYIIGWYILEGDRLFIRRFDPVLALLLMVFFCYGFFHLVVVKYKKYSRALIFVGIIFLSWSITTVYASGPDIRVVSQDEFQVAKIVSIDLRLETKGCVLADTWELLAIEGVTQGTVVGGGFPIDASFGQKERVLLYSQLLQTPDVALKQKVADLTGAQTCFFILPKNSINLSKISQIFGNPRFQNQSLAVWKIGLKNTDQ